MIFFSYKQFFKALSTGSPTKIPFSGQKTSTAFHNLAIYSCDNHTSYDTDIDKLQDYIHFESISTNQ